MLACRIDDLESLGISTFPSGCEIDNGVQNIELQVR